MFWVTRYPIISKTESGRVGYRKKYRVAGRVRVPAGHWSPSLGRSDPYRLIEIFSMRPFVPQPARLVDHI